MRIILLLLLCAARLHAEEKTVFLTTLVRDQAHLLPRYLKNIENLDYDKKLITVHFYTYNNSDQSGAHLLKWSQEQKTQYKDIVVETVNFPHIPKTLNFQAKEYSPADNKAAGELKDRGLIKAKEHSYYFFVDPTAYIAPSTLKELIEKDKPMIAPLLKSIPECDDHHSNFFYKVTDGGYYEHDENYIKILFRWTPGTFNVPLIRDVLLVKREVLDKLSYSDGSDDYDSIILARTARKNNVEQYITNEKELGVKIHFFKTLSREEENRRLRNLLLMP